MNGITQEDIARRFTYHKPSEEQIPIYNSIRDNAKKLAEHINANVPAGREKSLAITKLEEAVMWANAGVARSG